MNKEYLSWDETFLSLCKLIALRSKNKNNRTGSCIVDEKRRIISLGYNGLPFEIDDKSFSWNRSAEHIYDTKYPYIVHAEANAISSASHKDLNNAKLYVTLMSCNNCAAKVIQVGIKEVIYISDKYALEDNYKAARRMLDASNIRYRQVEDVPITVSGYQKTIKR
jgi:dCMP deaminase